MMKSSTIMMLPPKMAQQYADRAKIMDRCVKIGKDGAIYEFADFGSTVICLVGLDPPQGHSGKDATRADEIRKELAEKAKP